MSQFSPEQVNRLLNTIVAEFPGAYGQQTFKTLCSGAGIDFAQYEASGWFFSSSLNELLIECNRSEGGLEPLLEKLSASGRPSVQQAIYVLKNEVLSTVVPGRDVLTAKWLVIDGDPFLDHDDLLTKIMPRLVDDTDALRAVIMTGPSDSGKTFSLQAIRRYCRQPPPPAKKLKYFLIDPAAIALTRDSVELARAIAKRLRLDLRLPEMDTSEARIAQRLVDEIETALEWSEPIGPAMLVFDHLDKDIAPDVTDFIEQIALAVAHGHFDQMRTLLIGFPRPPTTAFRQGRLLTDSVTQPGPSELGEYIDRVLAALNRDFTDDTLTTLVMNVFRNQRPPYSRDFMSALPNEVLRIVDRILKAPVLAKGTSAG